MNPYVIYTDSACDISPAMLEEWGVKRCDLSFQFVGEETVYTNFELTPKEFYQRMRDGGVAKTSAVNSEAFRQLFEEELKNGNDVLYIGFSSGLSTTYNCARMAAAELEEAYEGRRVCAVDTLSASAGFGMLLYLAVREKEKGATLEEVARFVEEQRMHQCHWFTVDDLVYLKRGGRVSSAVALLGGVLGIKPVLHMDDEGHLINRFKVRGRKAALKALADKYGELAVDREGPVFISHGDCEEEAAQLAAMLKEEYGITVDLTVNVGPVIGAHSGPGTMALFFIGKER
ncbi:MAG: DegV family protein [Ruminococcaceae bacterium]|nr:DegV family protein [Oscillospiraceae bacterium]